MSEIHPANLNATKEQKAIRNVARISRLYQAIAQKGHFCPVEELHAELAHLQGELQKRGYKAPESHDEAAVLWKKLDPDNPHADIAVKHDEHGNLKG